MMVRTSDLASDKLFMGKLRFHEILELDTADADRSIGSRDERAAGCRENGSLVALCDTEALAIQFRAKGCAPVGEGCPERRSIEVMDFSLRTFPGNVRKSLDPRSASCGACWLHQLTVGGLVSPRECFETSEVVSAIQNPEGTWVDLRDSDMEMSTPLFDVPDDQARAAVADTEFRIN